MNVIVVRRIFSAKHKYNAGCLDCGTIAPCWSQLSVHALMKRQFSSFLLCLAMFALPIQGAAAAVMTVCSIAEAAGLSMPERHAAIKAVVDAGMAPISQADHAHGHDAAMDDGNDMPVWHDIQPVSDTRNHSADHQHAADTCGARAMLLPEIPLVALQHRRHALPLTTPVSFAGQPPQAVADHPPARRC